MDELSNMNTSKPKQNDEFPWHHTCWQQFIQARSQNQLPHAILLTGEEGIGKLALAKRMAKSLVCINNESNPDDACNSCKACKTYDSGANPDYSEIRLLDDKLQIGVDQVRELSSFLHHSRSFNTTRVVIINPVERMNLNAANSLLKSLEEPTEHTVMILVTSQLSQLLATIKSRCQTFTVKTPSIEQSIAWLKTQQSKQSNEQNDNETDAINPEKALEITGNKPLKAIQLNADEVEQRRHFFKDLYAIIKQQLSVTEVAKKWDKQDLARLLNWQVIAVQNSIKNSLSHFESSTENSSDLPSYVSTKTNVLTQHLTQEEQWLLYQKLLNQKQYIHTSVNSLMFTENMLLLWLKSD